MTPILTLTLPWPSCDLGQNSRGHWTKKADATAAAREAARFEAVNAINLAPGAWQTIDGPLKMTIVLNPPDRKRYDGWNICDRLKASIDGIFDALRQDDNLIRAGAWDWGEPVRGGQVEVTIGRMGE